MHGSGKKRGSLKWPVHILSEDLLSLCGYPPGSPGTWPRHGHKYTRITRDGTCPECIEIAKKLKG